ncbi:MAG TPA: histidine phosphatase family protein [Acidimicrobiales bacterium]|nr:histidine phosphatase family protein [Acidimicrobiales bacterium]
MAPRAGHDRRTLVLVRHAKSSWDEPSLPDHDRPLARRGQKALPRMRDHLERLRIHPDVVLCSSAARTRQTLDGIRAALGKGADIEIEDDLYAADAEDLLARLRRLGDDVNSALVVGHNPGLADLADVLTGNEGAPDAVPTGAIAVLSLNTRWSDLASATASLDSFWQPRPPR